MVWDFVRRRGNSVPIGFLNERRGMFRKVLYAVDLQGECYTALPWIIRLKKSGMKEVFVIHIYDERKIDFYWEIKYEYEQYRDKTVEEVRVEVIKEMLRVSWNKLKEVESKLQEAGIDTKIIVEVGIPCKKIPEIAEREKASLIVLEHKKRRGINVGKTTMRILDNAKCPVFVVKEGL